MAGQVAEIPSAWAARRRRGGAGGGFRTPRPASLDWCTESTPPTRRTCCHWPGSTNCGPTPRRPTTTRTGGCGPRSSSSPPTPPARSGRGPRPHPAHPPAHRVDAWLDLTLTDRGKIAAADEYRGLLPSERMSRSSLVLGGGRDRQAAITGSFWLVVRTFSSATCSSSARRGAARCRCPPRIRGGRSAPAVRAG